MQAIVVAKPYQFVPPHRGTLWPKLLRPLNSHLMRKEGVQSLEIRGADKLAASVAAGHGVVLAPNHCRPADPFVVTALGYAVGRPVHTMASWHSFVQGPLQRFVMTRAGVFSVYREGMDREALKCAIQILVEARRPLVLFPEGVISRHNDRLNSLMEGTALIARSAAKQRAAAHPGRVVLHPVAIRYLFEGDLNATAEPMLEDIEKRLSWQPKRGTPMLRRIEWVGSALLAAKETEYLGAPRSGAWEDRVESLIDHLLRPLEDEWLSGRHEGDVIARVKLLRTALLPDLVAGQLTESEQEARWSLLARVYVAQQLALYPQGYLDSNPTPERILETLERFEEDTTDKVRRVAPLRALLEVGDALEVGPERLRGGDDPLMTELRVRLEAMLAASLARHRPGR